MVKLASKSLIVKTLTKGKNRNNFPIGAIILNKIKDAIKDSSKTILLEKDEHILFIKILKGFTKKLPFNVPDFVQFVLDVEKAENVKVEAKK